MTEDLQALKAAVSLVDVLAEDGHELRRAGANFVCRCPFHQERSGSFTVFPDQHFKCFGCGSTGDVLDYWQTTRQVELAQAKRDLQSRAGIPPTFAPLPARRAAVASTAPAWPALRSGAAKEIAALAKLRGLHPEALRIADSVGWLRFGVWKGRAAWFVRDTGGQNLQARRMDGQRWEEIGEKAWTMRGARAGCPIGTEQARHYSSVLLVEGGPDLLAALHYLLLRGDMATACPVAILGASNFIPEDALQVLAGKRVRVYPHVDANGAGMRAAERWAAQLSGASCVVDFFHFDGLKRADGKPVADLNDAALVAPADAHELEGLLS